MTEPTITQDEFDAAAVEVFTQGEQFVRALDLIIRNTPRSLQTSPNAAMVADVLRGAADVVESLRSALNEWVQSAESVSMTDGWEPGRWYRLRQPDGSLWMETSNPSEARAEAERTGWPLERQYVKTQAEWRYENPKPTS